MCEERILKIKREMRHARRRARRLHQIHNFIANPGIGIPAEIPSSSESDSSSVPSAPMFQPEQRLTPSESIQCLQDVAARTIILMQRNQEIQRRVEELKRETNAYVNSVVNNTENQPRLNPVLMIPTPFQTPPSSEYTSDTSSSNYDDDSRSLPDVEDGDANDAFDVELKPDFQFKHEPI